MHPVKDTRALANYLTDQHGLSPAASRRVIEEVVAYFDQTLEDFVRSRHHELQQRGLSNPEAFLTIREEISARRFAVQTPSERQIRRIVYG